MSHLENILEFNQLLLEFRKIERDIFINELKRNENNAEHSFQLALMSWYLNHSLKKNLDDTALIQYSLIHDLIEIYAGDTPVYSKDQNLINSKPLRESQAMQQLTKKLKDHSQIIKKIHSYQSKSTPESAFVYAVDKLLPLLNIFQDNGYAWKTHNLTIDIIQSTTLTKLEQFPEIENICKDLFQKLKERPDLFQPL